jgi:hypothetical protein
MEHDDQEETTIMDTETTKMTCDDFIAALRRDDFTSEDLMNIARWAKSAEARLAKKGIAGARPGDTLILTDRDGTGRVTLDKVNRTKAEVTLIDAVGRFEAGSMVTCPIACLTREVA